MSHDFTLFIVDDAESARIMLESAFAQKCRVKSFKTAEDCLAHLHRDGAAPNLFLLDVDLPGMDGYTLCREIKELPGLVNIPVIFISTLDNIGSRLQGYDAGGIDYVVKPYSLAELKQKVWAFRRQSSERLLLNDKMIEAETLSGLLLANLDEYAVLIKFLRALNDCSTPRHLLDALFDLLRAYRLQSAIQLRLPGLEMTVGEDGDNQPIEVAVFNNVRQMDRIFEFKKRAVYNFEHISILINNVPEGDPDLCGRIRDNVAIAAECANAKLQTLEARAENVLAKGTAGGLLSALQSTVQDFDHKYAQARYSGTSVTQDLLDELTAAFASLGLSDEQENGIENIVRTKTENLAEIYDFSGETQETLNDIADRLAYILKPKAALGGLLPALDHSLEDIYSFGLVGDLPAVANECPRSSVELF
jgi:DNA-binding response OmpR family regulator